MSESAVKGQGSIYSETIPDPGDLGALTLNQTILTPESEGIDNDDIVDTFVTNLEQGVRDKSVSDKILGAYFKYVKDKSTSSTDDETDDSGSMAIALNNYANLNEAQMREKELSNTIDDLEMISKELSEMKSRNSDAYQEIITLGADKAPDDAQVQLSALRNVLDTIDARITENDDKLFKSKGKFKKVQSELTTIRRTIVDEQLARSKETSPLKSVLANYEQYATETFKLKDDEIIKIADALTTYVVQKDVQSTFLLNGLILNLYDSNSEECKFIQGLSDTFNSELDYVKKSINESISILPQEKSNVISRKLMETLTNISNIIVSKSNPMLTELRFLDKLIKAGFDPSDWTTRFGVTASGAIKRILDTWGTKESALTYIDLQHIFFPTVITPSIYIDTMTLEASSAKRAKAVILDEIEEVIKDDVE